MREIVNFVNLGSFVTVLSLFHNFFL